MARIMPILTEYGLQLLHCTMKKGCDLEEMEEFVKARLSLKAIQFSGKILA